MDRGDDKGTESGEGMIGGGRRRLPQECRRIAALLPALPDGELRPGEARRVNAHLAVCPDCRREADLLLGMGDLVRQAGVAEPPLPSGEAAVRWVLQECQRPETGTRMGSLFGIRTAFRSLLPSRTSVYLPPGKLALGAAVAALAALGLLLLHPGSPYAGRMASRDRSGPGQRDVRPEDLRPQPRTPPRTPPERPMPQAARPAPAWRVARLAGAPLCGSKRIGQTGRLRVGEWIETDSASRARIDVADIGHVEVRPNTRIRLVATRPNEHRLSMARGGLQARIKAPPRLFFVETPEAVAVDLGCAYTLEVDEKGCSVLHVTSGWVALVRGGRESIVSEGARCETRPGIGLGTPYREDAPPALQEALAAFDFEEGGKQALGKVLAAAQEPDSLTLWHLLSRAAPADRGRVYNRLKALVPPPPAVSRYGVLQLDEEMLDQWREEIEAVLWSAELGLPG
jgi:hypothetical protein